MKMMDLIARAVEITSRAISNGGEFSDQDYNDLKITEENAATKMEALHYVAKAAEEQARALQSQIEDVAKTARTLLGKKEWALNEIRNYLVATGKTELSGSLIRASLTTQGKKVVIENVDLLPDDLVEVERTPKRTAIKEMMELGETVPGARLEDVTALRFGISKGDLR